MLKLAIVLCKYFLQLTIKVKFAAIIEHYQSTNRIIITMFSTILFLTLLIAAVTSDSPPTAGYQPSGWRPSGPIFRLPNLVKPQESSVNSQPELQYGAPVVKQVNAPDLQETLQAPPNRPAATYGPPVVDITTTESVTEEDLVTTTEIPERENVTNSSVEVLKENLQEEGERGVYYIYHPTGLLQKVTYLTQDDQVNMAYSAKLKYENVEPINGPVYTYDPQSFEFKRLQ